MLASLSTTKRLLGLNVGKVRSGQKIKFCPFKQEEFVTYYG